MPIEGYVIVSANGMLADASGKMPDSLKFDGDQKFFERALDDADLIVHGRHSFEDQPRSHERKRLVLTRQVSSLETDDDHPHSTLWNPDGISFEEACASCAIGPNAKIAIIGGPVVYELFLDRYDTFWLSQAQRVTIDNGVGVFPGVPDLTPQDILTKHGLAAAETIPLGDHVSVTAWRRQIDGTQTRS